MDGFLPIIPFFFHSRFTVLKQGSPNSVLEDSTLQDDLPTQAARTMAVELAALQELVLKELQVPVGVPKDAKTTSARRVR